MFWCVLYILYIYICIYIYIHLYIFLLSSLTLLITGYHIRIPLPITRRAYADCREGAEALQCPGSHKDNLISCSFLPVLVTQPGLAKNLPLASILSKIIPIIPTKDEFITRRRLQLSSQPMSRAKASGTIFYLPFPLQNPPATHSTNKSGLLTVSEAICFCPVSFSSLYVRAFQLDLKFSIIKS